MNPGTVRDPNASAALFPDPIPANALQRGDPNGNWFWHGYFARHSSNSIFRN